MDKLPDSVIKPGRERKTAKRAIRRPHKKDFLSQAKFRDDACHAGIAVKCPQDITDIDTDALVVT